MWPNVLFMKGCCAYMYVINHYTFHLMHYHPPYYIITVIVQQDFYDGSRQCTGYQMRVLLLCGLSYNCTTIPHGTEIKRLTMAKHGGGRRTPDTQDLRWTMSMNTQYVIVTFFGSKYVWRQYQYSFRNRDLYESSWNYQHQHTLAATWLCYENFVNKHPFYSQISIKWEWFEGIWVYL